MKNNKPQDTDWKENKNLILYRLDNLDSAVVAMEDAVVKLQVAVYPVRDFNKMELELNDLNKKVVSLQERITQRAAIWGIIGGAVPVLIMILIKLWM